MGAPENFNGAQDPKFGNAYSGLYFFAPGDYREYIQVPLKQMLQKGKTYTVSFYASLAEDSDFAVKDFGVLFSHQMLKVPTKKNLSKGRLYQLKKNRHHVVEINQPEFHEDKSDWLVLKTTFEAKGFEKYVVLGNLRDNAMTRKVRTKRKETKKGAYYYIDMISLLPTDMISKSQLKPLEFNKKYVFENVHFNFDAFDLDKMAKEHLSKVFDQIDGIPNVSIEVQGHTDNTGHGLYNTILSEKRAKAIADYLVFLGLDPDSVVYSGYGSSRPIAKNTTEAGRRKNRRAEFVLKIDDD